MLSDVLPLFENMGVEVADERPYPIAPRDGDGVWIYDFGLIYSGEGDLDTDGLRESFQDTFVRAWRGHVENDAYNRLVLGAALTWREITVLRAIGKYLRQARITYSDRYVEQALVAHPEIARLLVALFQARFDPRRTDREDAEEVAARIEEAIDAVESLDQDQILRMFLDVIRAMLRTNYFQAGPAETAGHLSFKLDPSELRWLPQPRPRFEIFVYSPRTEGVHLRGGAVARGGIRWSDRREDFRTEVLGLMKAQMVKNAVIVPVGAKGGFVVKRPPAKRDDLPDGGDRLLPDLHPRAARPDRRHRRRRGRPARGRRPLRRRRPVPRGGRRQGHGDLLRHRQRHRARGGLLARRRVRLGRLDRLRPQEDGHHGARRLGVREAPLPRARARRAVAGLHGGRASATCPATCSATGCCCRATSGWSGPSTTATCSSTRTRTPSGASRSAGACSSCPRSSWDDYDRDLISAGGGIFDRAAKSIPLSPRDARGARLEERVAQAERAGPGAPARARGPALERRHRDVREGRLRVARGRGRQGERRACAWTPRSCAPRSWARAATSASRSAAGSSTRSQAGASTPTRSTTPAASTAPTAR